MLCCARNVARRPFFVHIASVDLWLRHCDSMLLLLYMLVWGWWMRIFPTLLNGKKDNPTSITLYKHASVGGFNPTEIEWDISCTYCTPNTRSMLLCLDPPNTSPKYSLRRYLEQQGWIGFLCNSLGWFPPPFSTNQHQHGARQRLQQYIYILHFPSVPVDLSVWYRCLHHNAISQEDRKISKI